MFSTSGNKSELDTEDAPFFHMRKCIWDLVEAEVKPTEREEIRRIIGEKYIDDNKDLQREVTSLYEILLDYQKEVAEFRESLSARKPRLPATPAREFLEQQICLLLDNMQIAQPQALDSQHTEKSNGSMNNRETAKMSPGNEVLEYITRKRRSREGKIGPETPRPFSSYSMHRPASAVSSVSSSRNSIASAPEALLEPIKSNLNVFQVDKCVETLRQALLEEREMLLEDVEYLQSCLEMEHEEITEEKKTVDQSPPSISEMRKYSQQLEEQWLQQEQHKTQEAILQSSPTPAVARYPLSSHEQKSSHLARSLRVASPTFDYDALAVKPRPPTLRPPASASPEEFKIGKQSSATKLRKIVHNYRSEGDYGGLA